MSYESLFPLLKFLMMLGGVVILFLISYCLYEAIRILLAIRRIIDRIEFLSDARLWLKAIKGVPRLFRRKYVDS